MTEENPVEQVTEPTAEVTKDTLEALRRDMETGFRDVHTRLDSMEADFSEKSAFEPRVPNEPVINNAQEHQEVEAHADPYVHELRPVRHHGIFKRIIGG